MSQNFGPGTQILALFGAQFAPVTAILGRLAARLESALPGQ
jgi:hypothetical protein